MQVNAISTNFTKTRARTQNTSNFSRSDISFSGNIQMKDISSKLSETDTNLVFKANKKTNNVNINGKKIDKKNILVTGASGYIGSHTAKYLLENGYDIVTIDNYTLGNNEANKELKKIAKENGAKIKSYSVDIADRKKISKIFADNKIDAVVHFAAYSQVGESVKDPYKYYLNNTAKTTTLLDEMKKAGVNKIVFSSTAATYGDPDEMPIKETTAQKPNIWAVRV